MTLRRGNASVRSTSLDCRSAGLAAVESEEAALWASAKGSRVNDLFWSNSIRSMGFL